MGGSALSCTPTHSERKQEAPCIPAGGHGSSRADWPDLLGPARGVAVFVDVTAPMAVYGLVLASGPPAQPETHKTNSQFGFIVLLEVHSTPETDDSAEHRRRATWIGPINGMRGPYQTHWSWVGQMEYRDGIAEQGCYLTISSYWSPESAFGAGNQDPQTVLWRTRTEWENRTG
ncbi:hypothetical protein NQZ68_013913 [Dissostichus eleginoides]|nr:hypothetical protein NQZ68_013913 [Dissostichus eleginoides]